MPISGFAMLQHQIKAVHESAHQEEKQRQDQGDLERRPPFNTRSPTILDRDGKRPNPSGVLPSPLCCSSLRKLLFVDTQQGTFYRWCTYFFFRLLFDLCAVS